MTVAEFGATPWGRAWLRTIESATVTVPDPLLPKARSLVRNDAVTSLSLGAGRVDGVVGVRGVSHHVRIELPLWDDRARRYATRLLADARTGDPGLASGDLPDSLEVELGRHGVAIAVPAGERVVECSCPARRSPCVHALATLYALVRRIDEHPAVAVEVRGVVSDSSPVTDSAWIRLTDLNAQGFYSTPVGF